MQINELREQLKSGRAEGVYVFCGEEDFLKRHYLRELRALILTEPAFDAFNRIVLEGERVDFDALSDAVKAPPMMAERKLVEWHLADFSAMREGDLTRFAALCEEVRDDPETVVCFSVDADCLDVGTLPKRPSRLYERLGKTASVVAFMHSDERALVGWLSRHFTHEGVSAAPAVLSLLVSHSGRSMDALAGEVAKLTAYVRAQGRSEVVAADIAAVCATGGESEDAFALSNALLDGRIDLAYDALLDMKRKRTDPAVCMAAIARMVSDLLAVALLSEEGMEAERIATTLGMHKYKASLYIRAARARGVARLSEALRACREADTAAKTGGGMGGYLAVEHLLARVLA